MKRDAPGVPRGWRSFFAAAVLGGLAACGDAAPAQHPIVDEPPTPSLPSAPKAPPVHTGAGVSPQSVPAMDAAPTLPAHCSSPEVRRIPRPASTNDPTLGRFSYRFRYKPPAAPGAPVLVFLPGGPGQTSTEDPPSFIPPDWGYLLTDPRGTGCNALKDVPYGPLASGFFRTRELAEDVVAALDTVSAPGYVLLGTSYGSMVGQAAAALMEERGLYARAVVLDGAFGRAFRPDEFVMAAYIDTWDRLHALLPADVRAELRAGPNPYGLDTPTWSRALIGMLPESPAATLQRLAALSPRVTPDHARRAAILDGIRRRGADNPIPAGQAELRRQILCREIAATSPGSGLDVVLMSGFLVRNVSDEGTLCDDLRVTAPFDAAAIGYGAPVYTFVGEDDVAAPPWQGAYAFEQHQGRAIRVTVRGGAHRALTGDLGACAPAVLASIAAGGADLARALAACPATVQVDTK
jgi:pimeloyl-ACP methyl ester carboxylesterase